MYHGRGWEGTQLTLLVTSMHHSNEITYSHGIKPSSSSWRDAGVEQNSLPLLEIWSAHADRTIWTVRSRKWPRSRLTYSCRSEVANLTRSEWHTYLPCSHATIDLLGVETLDMLGRLGYYANYRSMRASQG